MPDPLTITAAITLAGKAVSSVSKLVQSGRELEDCASHISRWFECCSDVNKARERAENPPFFKKLTNSSSVQAEAMDAVIAQKKMRDQRAQLRELIMWQWGKDEWDNLLAQEKQIREKRQKLIHDRIVLKQKIFDFTIGIVGVLAILGIIIGFIWIISLGG
jgi:CHASE3 domain sensor protein